jgi:CBS domain-containing protein
MTAAPLTGSAPGTATAAAALAAATAGFLRSQVPFDRMPEAQVLRLAAASRIRYWSPGQTLLAPGDGPPAQIWIIQRGRVERQVPWALLAPGDAHETLQAGELFPVTAVLDARPVACTYRAIGDVFCHEIDGDTFRALLAESPPLQAFCAQRLRTMLEQSRAALQARCNEASSGEQSMTTRLADLIGRTPLGCAPDTPVATVLETLRRERIGCMVVVDADARPVGIFTERDVVDRAARGLLDGGAPISALMTTGVHLLPCDATVGDAVLSMVRHSIRHVVVVRDARFTGVVSQRDVFALQRVSFFRVAQRVDGAGDIETLSAAAGDIRVLARNLLAQGVAAEALTRFVSELNDHVVQRVLTLVAAGHVLDDAAFAWISLGSEGRREQTIATDQDNGIVFLPPQGTADIAALRARLIAFAGEANTALDRCGFPLCRGQIMAGNPRWCLSIDEWHARFDDWLRNPVPQALLSASIFFDLRPIGSAPAAVIALRDWLADAAPRRGAFLQALARNALETRPPLGWFGGLTGSGRGDQPDAIDLKLHGARIFVDAARVLALAHGVSETGTAARLRTLADRGVLPSDEADAATDAFHILQQLRLRLQFGDPAGVAGHPNAVLPEALNAFDRRVLKEALFQARRLQQRLAADYRL